VEDGNPVAGERAAHWLQQAHRAAEGTTWLREVQQQSGGTVAVEPIDEAGTNGVIVAVTGSMKSAAAFEACSGTMLTGLSQTNAPDYEQALVTLGTLLGAESYKPAGKGQTDAAWVWPDMWITVEAKSEQKEDGPLSMQYVRKTNTQMDSLAADRGEEEAPAGSFSLIVSPRRFADPAAIPIARAHLYLTTPDLLLDVAHDTVRAWKQIRGGSRGVEREALRKVATQVLWEHQVLPTQVRERLTRDPIRGR
jgi:hypothetical protein